MKHLISLSILILSFQVSGQDWVLIYENNELGKAVSGNIEDLKAAVRDGKEVRIGWGFQHPTERKVSVEHVADASFLTIQSDSIIHAQIRPIVGQTPDFEKGVIILKENLEWVFIGGTNGAMDTMMRNTVSGEIVSHRQRFAGFKWFVKN